MKRHIVFTLVAKDLKLYYRDKFFGIMSVFTFILFVMFFFIMPRSVDETISIGFHGHLAQGLVARIQKEGGAVIMRRFDSEEALKAAVLEEAVHFGIDIPDDLFIVLMSGQKPRVRIYLSSDLPPDLKDMYAVFMGEMMGGLAGAGLNLQSEEIILGPDMAGKQIPFRDRLLPLFVFMLLIMETFGLATLITLELETDTARALLTTPMTVVDLFAGKGLAGVIMAFGQAVILMGITRSLAPHTLLILFTLLLSAMMVTGLAFIIAAISRDMMSVTGWGTLAIMVFAIPAVAMLLGGNLSVWIKMIPSYYVVSILDRAVNFHIGWSGNWHNLLMLAGCNIAFVITGILTLKRKLA